MPSFLERLGMGLGKGLEVAGKMGLEEQREKRLAKLREGYRAGAAKESEAFTAGEAETERTFKSKESALERTSREKLATSKGAKPDLVKETIKGMDSGLPEGDYIEIYHSGKSRRYSAEQDKFIDLGAGAPESTEETIAEDKAWAVKQANRKAGLFSGDEADFPIFKDEDTAAEAAAQFRSNARKEGKLDEFNTEFAKRGWDYINELAGGKPEQAAKPSSAGSELTNVFKDFDESDHLGVARQIVKEARAPAALKRQAQVYIDSH